MALGRPAERDAPAPRNHAKFCGLALTIPISAFWSINTVLSCLGPHAGYLHLSDFGLAAPALTRMGDSLPIVKWCGRPDLNRRGVVPDGFRPRTDSVLYVGILGAVCNRRSFAKGGRAFIVEMSAPGPSATSLPAQRRSALRSEAVASTIAKVVSWPSPIASPPIA